MLTARIFRPKDPFAEMSQEMDRLFESFVPSALPRVRRHDAPRTVFPALNVWSDNEAVFAEAELPGVKLDDIEVSTTHNLLTIKGSRSISYPENATVLRGERGQGTFERTIELPFEIDTDKVEAQFKHGVLRITMPKAEAARRKLVKIKTH